MDGVKYCACVMCDRGDERGRFDVGIADTWRAFRRGVGFGTRARSSRDGTDSDGRVDSETQTE